MSSEKLGEFDLEFQAGVAMNNLSLNWLLNSYRYSLFSGGVYGGILSHHD